MSFNPLMPRELQPFMAYRLPFTGVSEDSTDIQSVEHDRDEVRVITKKGTEHRKFAIVCPNAGKFYCWPEFEASFSQLPVDDSHVLLYDNSLDPIMGERMEKLASSLDHVTLIRDTNPHVTLETTGAQACLIERCGQVYEEIYGNHLPSSDYVINLEDDISLPDHGWDVLWGTMCRPGPSIVIPNCHDRRVASYNGEKPPIACNFVEMKGVGGLTTNEVACFQVEEKQSGIEEIGAGHMGFWVTSREVVDTVGMTLDREHSVPGHDIQFGYRAASEHGVKTLIDWDVTVRHFMLDNRNRKVSV